jgi:capsular exopolysaccharide synthesis family protein
MKMSPRLHEEERIPIKTETLADLSHPLDGEVVDLRAHPQYPLIIDAEHKDVAESFSILRTRLLNARAKSGLCSVLITSAQKQEGKSLICMNLAISLASLARDRVLLVDGDLRMQGITRLLSLQGQSGLGEFLQGRASFDACIRSTSLPQLSITTAGDVDEERLPAILEGPRWLEFIEQAKREFGLIIVDSVPVSAPIADFELLLASCDAALLVVQLRKTKWEALELVSNRMNGKLLGLVVNNTDPPPDFEHYPYSRGK